MIKAIAIDDEPIALEIIEIYAKKIPFLSLQGSFTNAFEGLDYLKLKDNQVQLLFLDIKMPDISGIDFFKSLTTKPYAIFTTAYSEHAVTGFELEAVDYLLKPFSFPRFLKACNKVSDLISLRQQGNKADHIFIKDSFDVVRIDFIDILYLEATGNYVRYVLKDREILTRMTIKEAIEILPENQFIQVHRSFIVNLFLIDKMERHQIRIDNTLIPISTSFLSDVRSKLL
jgi:DNA-binding LytR/AlgR family response regulator